MEKASKYLFWVRANLFFTEYQLAKRDLLFDAKNMVSLETVLVLFNCNINLSKNVYVFLLIPNNIFNATYIINLNHIEKAYLY